MLGIFLIYFIGKAFYTLAEKSGKEQLWPWAVLGVVSYYVGGIILAIIYGIVVVLAELNVDIENMSIGTELVLGLVGGILACVGLYQFLKHRWSKTESIENDDILDIDFLDDNV